MNDNRMYQVSTLQALAMGYTRPVITVGDLLEHGDTGLGTYEDVDGEMILVDGKCYRANVNGVVQKVSPDTGVPFCSVTFLQKDRTETFSDSLDIDGLKSMLDVKIEERFGLNSMHMVRIDGYFESVNARSEAPFRSHHIQLRDILAKTQKDFTFRNLKGTLICVYYPDFMDGINAPGWHLHFISEGRTLGGHVFQLRMLSGSAFIDKVQNIEIQLPTEPAFDTYSLGKVSNDKLGIRRIEG